MKARIERILILTIIMFVCTWIQYELISYLFS